MSTTASVPTRILLVEDEPKLRRSLAEGLGLEGCQVTSAASGREALRDLERRTFDAVVLDWMLPDLNGLEIVRQLRRRGITTPVLIISAHDGPGAEGEIRQAGADAFLAKPFSFDDLLGRTRALATRTEDGARKPADGER